MLSRKKIIFVSILLSIALILILAGFFQILDLDKFFILLTAIIAGMFLPFPFLFNFRAEIANLKMMVASLKLEKNFLENQEETRRLEEEIEKVSREFEEMLKKNKGKIVYH